MIVLITTTEANKHGIRKLVVSHGIDPATLKSHILPTEPPLDLGAKFNTDLGEWVLEA